MPNVSALTLGGIESFSLSSAEKKFIEKSQPSGVTLFSRNLENPNSIESPKLIRELQEIRLSSLPFIFAVDQEGGRVARVKQKSADFGPASDLLEGLSDQEALLGIKGKAFEQGQALKGMGFNVNFAPVVDVGFPKEKQELCFLGDRAFGSDPAAVVKRASAFLAGLHRAGVFGCLKHYPGIGQVQADTHLMTAYSEVDQETFERRNLFPFEKMNQEVELIMVAHCIFPNFSSLEASRSRILLTDILRTKLQYKGLVVCDDLNMKAVPDSEPEWREFVVAAVAAGCDLLLICRGLESWKMACDALTLERRKSPAFTKRLEEALSRIQSFRKKLSL